MNKNKLTPQERFTVYKYDKNIAIMDKLTEEEITEKEYSDIMQEEYGEFLKVRENLLEDLSQNILYYLRSYNMGCEKGFEISIEELNKHLLSSAETERQLKNMKYGIVEYPLSPEECFKDDK